MSDLERIGISLDKDLLERFDARNDRKHYANRSEAVRDLIRNCLDQEDLHRPAAKAMGVILLVYDHHQIKLTQRLLEIQHHHLIQTISTQHVHLDHDTCLEVILLKGKVSQIHNLADQLTSIKGVKLSRVNLVTAGGEHSCNS